MKCCYFTRGDNVSNQLKRASSSNNNKHTMYFNQKEVDILRDVFKICQIYISKNKNQFQQPQDILQEINDSINILELHKFIQTNEPLKPSGGFLKGASVMCANGVCCEYGTDKILKGASSNNTCNKKEHLTNIRKMIGLIY